MGRKLLAAVLALLPFAFAGCWSAREIDRLAFIMLIGFDRPPGGEGYIVTFRVMDPGATRRLGAQGEVGGQEPGTISLAFEAKNPAEALDTFRLSVARRPFLSHVQAVLIGEELAREGIDEVIDFLERHPEIRRSVVLLVTRGSAAARLMLDTSRVLQSGTGVVATGLLEQAPQAGSVEQVRFGDFLQWLGSNEREAFTPVLELSPVVPPPVGQLPSAAPILGGAAGTEGATAASSWQYRLSGIAVFSGSRLAGYLDDEETLAFSLVRNRLRRGTIALDGEEFKGAVEIVDGDASLRLELEGSRPLVRLEIEVETRLVATAAPMEASRDVGKERIERAVEAKLKEQTEGMVAKLQGWGADALGIGRAFHRRYPVAWREVKHRWSEVFSQAVFEVSVRAELRAAGTVAGR